MSNVKSEEKPIIDKEREALYARAAKAAGGEPPKTEDKGSNKDGEPLPEKKEEAVQPEPKKDDGTKPESKTVVPHEALHAERERRKAEQQKARELEEALKAEKARNEALMEDMRTFLSKPAEEEPADLEQIVRSLKERTEAQEKEIKALKSATEKWETFEKVERERSAKNELERNLDETDKRLEKAGYPGFRRFVPIVAQQLKSLVAEDPDTAPPDTPEGWERVYREKVFPSIREMFDKKASEKEAAKKEADIPTGSASGPGKPPPVKGELTPEEQRREYIKMRMGQSSA